MMAPTTPPPGVVLRPCAKQPCGELVEHGRCAKHKPQADRERGTSTQRGYDADFRALRLPCFERDGFTCVQCQWKPDIVREWLALGLPMPRTELILDELRERFVRNMQHLHADHIIPVDDAPHLRLVLSNLQTLCNQCHSAKTARETARDGV